MRLNFDKHVKIKMRDRNLTQRFDVVMTSLSSDKKITVQQCYICGERCDCSLTYLFNPLNTKLLPKNTVFNRLVRFFSCHDAK